MFSSREKLFILILSGILFTGIVFNIIKYSNIKKYSNKPEAITYETNRLFDSISAKILNIPDSTLKLLSTVKYDVNTVTRSQLEEIPGIGPVLADRIIQYRKKTGKISNLIQLVEIKGIGKKKFEDLKQYLFINK